MKKTKTFPKGGVHPKENKISSLKPIEKLDLPETVIIPVSQHIGAPSKTIVNVGDKVKTGQLIAKAAGFISANIHSSVSGEVIKIDLIEDPSGYKKQAIIIKVEGDDWVEDIDLSEDIKKDINVEATEIKDRVLSLGIVGLGGATFPSHVKLSVPESKKVDYLIINGVECEPYLTSDHRLMLERGEEILIGTQILLKGLRINKAFIGIENNKPDAIKHLTELAKNYNGIEIISLKVQYPQGAEKQLIKAITGREVPPPPRGLPIDVGCVVHNVGTAFAVYEAIQKNKPLVDRVVTLTGKQVKNPSNYLVRIGTPIANLVEASGGLPQDTGKIISGGPMMGRAITTLDMPVTKGTSGVTVISESESTRETVLNCIRCGRCVEACPTGLEPYLLMALSEKNLMEKAEQERIVSCCECGCCAFTCPSRRPLLDYIRLGKTKVMNIMRRRQ
ncbi:MAG: electron transport complex subunit RsxC [Candidatus Zapsychrus exili]|nr:electron transport complex subunit RsxC [Candidatus Zapsychrus exili]